MEKEKMIGKMINVQPEPRTPPQTLRSIKTKEKKIGWSSGCEVFTSSRLLRSPVSVYRGYLILDGGSQKAKGKNNEVVITMSRRRIFEPGIFKRGSNVAVSKRRIKMRQIRDAEKSPDIKR